MQLSAPQHLVNLRSSSYVVYVGVNTWVGSKQDRAVSNEVTLAKNATAESGKFTKMLMAGNKTHKELVNYRQTVYNWITQCTYDWAGKHRLLPSMLLPKVLKEFEEHKIEFNKLKDKFGQEYDSIISDMAFKQGDLFNKSDYPSKDEVLGKFGIKMFVTEVPENDFRNQVATELADDLRKHYEIQAEEIVNAATQRAIDRLITFAERISSACSEPEDIELEDGTVKKGRRKKVFDSTFDGARELCSVLEAFNPGNNPILEQARVKLQQALSNVKTEDVREYATTRKAVKDEVDDLLSQFGAFKRLGNQEDDE